MRTKTIIAPSVLAADFSRLGEEVEAVDGGRRRLDPSRRDGRAFRSQHHLRAAADQGDPRPHRQAVRLPFDDRAGRSLSRGLRRAGCDSITVHAEAGPHLDRSLQAIKDLGKRAGVALNPSTPGGAIEYVLDRLDLILLMTVNPGFGGQAFIAAVLDKIRRVKAMIGSRPIDIEIDGGITPETAPLVVGGRRRPCWSPARRSSRAEPEAELPRQDRGAARRRRRRVAQGGLA